MSVSVHCDIVNEQGEVFSGLVESLNVPGSLGRLGIYPGHSPLISELSPGSIELTQSGGKQERFYISGGFLEVQRSLVKILAYTD